MLESIVALAVGGLIIGGLGRLLVPGPNPIGMFRTAVVGLLGSFLGGLVARFLFGLNYRRDVNGWARMPGAPPRAGSLTR